jgi:hypothetical protein
MIADKVVSEAEFRCMNDGSSFCRGQDVGIFTAHCLIDKKKKTPDSVAANCIV